MATEVPPGFVPVIGASGEVTGYQAPTQSYGGGGGYGISTPSENDMKAAKLLSAIVNENAKILKDTYAAQVRGYDISDEMSRNLTVKKTCQARRKAGHEWYASQQKLQAASSQLTDVAGGAIRSSLFYDFVEMVSRADDQADTEVLRTMRENIQEIEMSLAEALMNTINSRNDASANTEQQLRQLFTDGLAQLINIHPDLASSASASPTGGVIIDLSNDVPADASVPSWIDYDDWFEGHTTQAIHPNDVPKSRPDKTAQMAWVMGYLKNQLEAEGASNPSYWEVLQSKSERNTQ